MGIVVTAGLEELASACARLADICEREQMHPFVPSFQAAARVARTIAAEPLDRDAALALVNEVSRTFSHLPGGFMDMYIVRANSQEQLVENERFEELRERARRLAHRIRDELQV